MIADCVNALFHKINKAQTAQNLGTIREQAEAGKTKLGSNYIFRYCIKYYE